MSRLSRKHLLSHTLLFFVLLTFSQKVYSQDTEVNSEIWLDYFHTYNIKEKLKYSGDTGYRTIIGGRNWNMIYVRPGVRYFRNEIVEYSGGVGFFYEFDRLISDRFEIRPWQGLRINWPTLKKLGLTRLSVNHFFRLEERISFLTQNSWENSFDLRGRYKFSTRLKLCLECTKDKWSIPFYFEVFLPLNNVEEIFRNRTRLGLGLDYDHSKDWRFGFLFHWQKSRIGIGEELNVSDLIFQFRFTHKFDSRPGFFEF